MAKPPALHIKKLGLSYGAHTVLDDVTLRVQPGQIFGLIGLNGQGKTTMIKAALDLCRPQSGEIDIFGTSSADPAARKQLTYLPERFEPAWFLNGYEFLKFSLAMHGHHYDREVALSYAQLLRLDESALDRRVKTYSKGMRQKLGLMAALMGDAPLCLLDEPMSGLDPGSRSAVKSAMKAARDSGRTVFFSSHILSDMDELCDEVALLHAQKIRFTGTPKKLRDDMGCATLEDAVLQLIDRLQAA